MLTNYSPSFFKEKNKNVLASLGKSSLSSLHWRLETMLPVLFYGLERWIWKIMGHIFPPLILKVFRINKRNIFYTKQHPFLSLLIFAVYLSVLCSYHRLVCCCCRLSLPSTTARYHPRASETLTDVSARWQIMRVEVYVFRGRDIPQVEDQSY